MERFTAVAINLELMDFCMNDMVRVLKNLQVDGRNGEDAKD